MLNDETINNFKSMYYLFNATPDTLMKVFNKDKIITKDNLLDLFFKIDEKMKTHQISEKIITVFITYNDGRNEKLSLPEFSRKDWKISSSTKTINVTWDFLFTMPQYSNPQPHSLSVRMGSRLRPDEYFKIMMESDNDAEIDSLMADLVCKVDFVNAVLGDELITKVEEWYKSLETDERSSKKIKFFRRHSLKISKFIEFISPVLAILIIYGFLKNYLVDNSISEIVNSSQELSKLVFMLVISIIFIMLFRYLGYLFAAFNHNKSKLFEDYSRFNLTNGDNNMRKRVTSNNKKVISNLIINIIATILSSILIGLWGFIF